MAEMDQDAVAGTLEGIFGNAPAAPLKPGPARAEAEPMTEDEEAIAEPDADVSEVEDGADTAAVIAEPEIEIEVNGQREVVRGADKIRELAQKGAHYSRGTEEVARVRESLYVQASAQQDMANFQQAAMGDMVALAAISQQLAQFENVDWQKVIDTDFVSAMKYQEQRATLRDQRQAKINELTAKHQQFQQSQAQAAQQLLASESAALLAKLPEWRNSDKATAERQAIATGLNEYYGYQAAEIAQLMDHRHLLVARDAMKWRELQKGKTNKDKQLRDAPPVVRPGAATTPQTNERQTFAKQVQEFRKAGRAGNHRAQETSLEKMLSRTFK